MVQHPDRCPDSLGYNNRNVVVTVGGVASNGVPFTLGSSPVITSANNAGFIVGNAGTFTVTATGTPAPTFSETGALPTGVTLISSGVLSGTPGAGTAGSYPITIKASNGVASSATQNFTLTVANQAKRHRSRVRTARRLQLVRQVRSQ
jgi:hypothetical protein